LSTLPKSTPRIPSEPSSATAEGWIAVPTTSRRRISIGFESLSERRRVLDWLNEGLREGMPGRLASEYPLLFDRNASAFHFTFWDRDQPVAFCTLWAVTYRVGVHRLRTGMISLVYTDPAQRGQGYAQGVVNAAIAHAEKLELGLILLWSDLDRLYRPLGFHPSGCESLLVIDLPMLEGAIAQEEPGRSRLRIEAAQPADWIEIERLRGYRTSQLELDPGEITRARAIPDLTVRVARDEQGIQSFAIRGRGDDFAEVIHEWGGDPGGALLCARELLLAAEPWNELFLLCPAKDDPLAWRLRRAGAPIVRQPMAWMRIASPAALASDLAPMLPEGQGLEIDFVDSSDPEGPSRLRLRSPYGEALLESAQWLEALFGSAKRLDRDPLLDRVAAAIGRRNCEELPIPFFVWGLESI